MKSSSNKYSKKALISGLVAALIVAGLAGFYIYDKNDSQATQEALPSGTEKIDLSPPTEEDKADAERNKDRIAAEEEATTSEPATGDKAPVTPVLGFVQQADNKNVEANGYISETIESGGTCTLTLEMNGVTVSQSKEALPDAQSTVCGLLTIDRSRLSAGEWKVRLSYSSDKYQGTSAERAVKLN